MRTIQFCLLALILAMSTGTAAAQDHCADIKGKKTLTSADPIEIVVLPNAAAPTADPNSDVKSVYLGLDGCIRYNSGSNAPDAPKFYTGNITVTFFDTDGHSLASNGQALVDGAKAVAFQPSATGTLGAHNFGAGATITYPLDIKKISNRVLIEVVLTECTKSDLKPCSGKSSSYVASGLFFNSSLPTPPTVSNNAKACSASHSEHFGPAFADVVMEMFDKPASNSGQAATIISIQGCLRFNPAKAPYHYYQGAVAALVFTQNGTILSPIGFQTQPYGQFSNIFPAGPLSYSSDPQVSPLAHPEDGFHAFGFEYEFDQISAQSIAPYVTLLLTAHGCQGNDVTTCAGKSSGPTLTFVQTVRPCFWGRRLLDGDHQRSACPSVDPSVLH